MRDEQIVLVAFAAGAALVIAVIVVLSRRTTSVRDVLQNLALSAGWTDLRKVFLGSGVRGMWRSFPVKLVYIARQKGTPQQFVLTVRARTDWRLSIKRKFEGVFSNKPVTWFGPPLVEVHHPRAQVLWVRSDEVGLAERLFSDDVLAQLISENLVARFDQISVGRRGLTIRRSLDDTPVRKKYDMPAFTWSFQPALFEPIARQELELSQAIVEKLMAV